MDKVFYVDVETTGLDCVLNDIIQIAFIVEIGGVIKERRNFKVKPDSLEHVSDIALKINGVSLEEIETFRDSGEVYQEFVGIIRKYVNRYDKKDKFIIVGYNVRFDINFILEWFKKNGDVFFWSYFSSYEVCVFSLVKALAIKGLIKSEKYRLIDVCREFDIKLKAHDAMSDIEATKVLFEKFNIGLKEKVDG